MIILNNNNTNSEREFNMPKVLLKDYKKMKVKVRFKNISPDIQYFTNLYNYSLRRLARIS